MRSKRAVACAILILWGLLTNSTASAWEARPKGYVLEEDSYVGTLAEGRALAEALNAQEAVIATQAEAIEDLRGSLILISGDLEESRAKQNETDQALAKLAESLNAGLETARKTGRSEGHKDAVKVGGVLLLLGGVAGLLAK